ncbi:MAG: glycoside hydrolase superfamily [Monoraphidium minutum]|nr:MAG: glycoside hydrolase superfamily [Monoraphidium minutum]
MIAGTARGVGGRQASPCLAPRPPRVYRRPRCTPPDQQALLVDEAPAVGLATRPQANIVPAGGLRQRTTSLRPFAGPAAQDALDASEPPTPLWVALSGDALKAAAQQPEAVLAGLKALKLLGVWGVSLDVHWGAAEPAPREFSWAAYRPALALVREAELKLQANFCFHADGRQGLPAWVMAVGEECPDIFYTDKAGERCHECLTLGVDHVPVLEGRTALQCYADLIAAFASDHAPLMGTTVTDARVGLGPAGELRYPAHPAAGGRWAFPGVGEFQCYDAFMLSSLAAAARQAGQPHWGTSGPHDAGAYTLWPHQTGFFHHQGSWGTEYGRFFCQWYSSLLAAHADAVLGAAAAALAGRGVRLRAALPCVHWWYHSASRAAELTAGYYGTRDRDAYLPAMRALARHGAAAHVPGAELTAAGQPAAALAAPETLLLQLRGVAAALGVPITLGNAAVGFDGRRLAELERRVFDGGCYQGVDVGPAAGVVLAEMGDAMFEPAAWTEFREWAARVRARGAAAGGGGGGGGAPAAAPPPPLPQQQQQHAPLREAAAEALPHGQPPAGDRGGPGGSARHTAVLV